MGRQEELFICKVTWLVEVEAAEEHEQMLELTSLIYPVTPELFPLFSLISLLLPGVKIG